MRGPVPGDRELATDGSDDANDDDSEEPWCENSGDSDDDDDTDADADVRGGDTERALSPGMSCSAAGG